MVTVLAMVKARSDGSSLGQKRSADCWERNLLRGSSQREGASSASVVSWVSNFVIVLKYTKGDFQGTAKISKNVHL